MTQTRVGTKASIDSMEPWERAEFAWARRLREAPAEQRHNLYAEAYSEVSRLRWGEAMDLQHPETRTAGTSPILAHAIRNLMNPDDDVLEFGCGRGYTACVIAPTVNHYMATDVCDASVEESRQLMKAKRIDNVNVGFMSAFGLDSTQRDRAFTVAISIDVVEHLHPDDAQEHFRQVFHALTAGGRYIICMPSRVTGPHDVTRKYFPDARQPLGFHLNELTYSELIERLKVVGFHRFSIFQAVRDSDKQVATATIPIWKQLILERLYPFFRNFAPLQARYGWRFNEIRLVAEKHGAANADRRHQARTNKSWREDLGRQF